MFRRNFLGREGVGGLEVGEIMQYSLNLLNIGKPYNVITYLSKHVTLINSFIIYLSSSFRSLVDNTPRPAVTDY